MGLEYITQPQVFTATVCAADLRAVNLNYTDLTAVPTLSVVNFETETITISGTYPQNTVLAAPAGANGAPGFRLLAHNHIPSLNASKITAGTLSVSRGGTGRASFTANHVLIGNGTSGINTVIGLTTTVNILSSNNSPVDLVFTNGVLTAVTI